MNYFHSFIKENKEKSVLFKMIKRRLNNLLIENGFNQEILFKTFHLKTIHFLDSKFKETTKENLNKRTLKNRLKTILDNINQMFSEYYLLLNSLNSHNKVKLFDNKDITDKTFMKLWLNQNNLELFTEEENYCLVREIFEQLEPFVKNYREKNGFETDCILESREEIIFLLDKLLTKINKQLFYTIKKTKLGERGWLFF